MRVTTRARAILHPDNLNERRENLLASAFDPDLFRELRDRWPDMIPPEEGIVTYLHRKGFNQSAIRPAMKAYRETLLFLEQEGVSESHGIEPSAGADSLPTKGGADAVYGKARAGDMVDVEIAGTLLTAEPVKVRAITDDGEWVFVEGSETGIQMDQVTVRERPAEAPIALKAPPKMALDDDAAPPPTGSRSESFNTDEGDIRITWPANLSAQSVADMTDWLDLLMRRIARRAGVKDGGTTASHDPNAGS